jgi:sugar phosphate isomerase/epimerase
MKLAYMAATQEIHNEKITCLKGEYDQVFQLIAKNGYTGVELMVRNPFEVDFASIEKSAKKYHLDIPVLCTGEVYGEDKLSFGDPNPSVRHEAIKRGKEAMKMAGNFRAGVNVGRLRGRFQDNVARKDTIAWIKDGFSQVAAANPNTFLMLEPVNHLLANYLLTTTDGVDFVKELNIPNVKMMLDYEHMIIEKENIQESVDRSKGYFKHIHICDSDRLPPGQGTFKFDTFFKSLHEVGYEGYVTVESFPTKDYEFDLKTCFQQISPLLNA